MRAVLRPLLSYRPPPPSYRGREPTPEELQAALQAWRAGLRSRLWRFLGRKSVVAVYSSLIIGGSLWYGLKWQGQLIEAERRQAMAEACAIVDEEERQQARQQQHQQQ
jgi:hypothetical protein